MAETKTVVEAGRILVRNIGNFTKRDIKTLFARLGPLTETKMPVDRLTKRQVGFAFVTFTTAKHAATATSTLNGTGFQGRTLNLTPNAREAPRVGSQRDSTTEGTPRMEDQGGTLNAKEQLQGHNGRNQEDRRVWKEPHQEPWHQLLNRQEGH